MQKFFLVISLLCFISPAFADNEVYLDLNADEIHQYKSYMPKYQNEKIQSEDDFSEEKEMILHPFRYIKDELFSSKQSDKK